MRYTSSHGGQLASSTLRQQSYTTGGPHRLIIYALLLAQLLCCCSGQSVDPSDPGGSGGKTDNGTGNGTKNGYSNKEFTVKGDNITVQSFYISYTGRDVPGCSNNFGYCKEFGNITQGNPQSDMVINRSCSNYSGFQIKFPLEEFNDILREKNVAKENVTKMKMCLSLKSFGYYASLPYPTSFPASLQLKDVNWPGAGQPITTKDTQSQVQWQDFFNITNWNFRGEGGWTKESYYKLPTSLPRAYQTERVCFDEYFT